MLGLMADAVGRLDFPAKLRKNTKKRKENGDNLQATAPLPPETVRERRVRRVGARRSVVKSARKEWVRVGRP